MPSLVLTAPPAVEPITVAEAQRHLRLDSASVEPVPSAPTVAISGAGAGSVDVGTHYYRCTFVTADGETDGGTVSAPLVIASVAHGQVQLSNIPIGGSLVTARKVYRTHAGGSDYFLVATVADKTTTTYLDNVADAALGAGIPLQNTTGDVELQALITAARTDIEEFLDRALITQHWAMKLDRFARGDALEIPRPPLITLGTITYLDPSGAVQTFATENYSVDVLSLPGRVILGYGKYWPYTQSVRNCVTVGFTAGYGPSASDVPPAIRHAIKLRVAELYEHREPAPLDQLDTVKALLWPHRYIHV